MGVRLRFLVNLELEEFMSLSFGTSEGCRGLYPSSIVLMYSSDWDVVECKVLRCKVLYTTSDIITSVETA